MPLVAGIDSSTQSCKVLILDAESGKLIRSGRASHPSGTEVDPKEWWVALLAAIDDAGGLADVAAVAVAGQQHGMVALDVNGEVVRDALLWNDTRSATAAEDLIAEVGKAAIIAKTGSSPVASLTSTKLRWLRENEPENASRVAAVALPHDWLNWRLQGFGPQAESALGPNLEALTTDRSEASGTGYWSPQRNAYDLELFELAFGRMGREAIGINPVGVDAAGVDGAVVDGAVLEGAGTEGHAVVLPRVLAASASAGFVAPELVGGHSGIKLGAGAGDNAAGALGLGASSGDVVISLGTSGTVYAISDVAAEDATGTVAGFADAQGGFLPIAVTLNAARVLSSTAELLGLSLTELGEKALSAQPGSDGVVLIPYFEGERTPNLPMAKASLHGLSISSCTPANVARASVEGMLYGLAQGLSALLTTGVHPRRVLLIGGAAQNLAVQEIAAQVIDVPIVVPAAAEYVARGAGVQASWVLSGFRPDWEVELSATPRAQFTAEIFSQYLETIKAAHGV